MPVGSGLSAHRAESRPCGGGNGAAFVQTTPREGGSGFEHREKIHGMAVEDGAARVVCEAGHQEFQAEQKRAASKRQENLVARLEKDLDAIPTGT